MSRQKVKDMPRCQQQAVMSKIKPGAVNSRTHNIKPSYNIPKKFEPRKKELREEHDGDVEDENKETF